jgi:type I restriction enzyme M protein
MPIIDFHNHFYPPAYLEALKSGASNVRVTIDADGNPEPDPELRDTENVPLKEDVNAFFACEVAPHVPDAWINTAICDEKDPVILERSSSRIR